MDLRYTLHLFADPDFYDAVERWNDVQSRFAVTRRPVPPGWSRVERGVWTVLHLPQVELPRQGWKIHVSACLDHAEDVLDIVWDYCIERNIAFKFLRSREILLAENSKYANRASSGKLLTLYPVGEAELHTALTGLAAALDGYQGPYILSDLRCGTSPVYVRYGAFLEQWCPTDNGDLVRAIATPDGRLVPDLRRPGFNVPPWVDLPSFIAAQVAAGGDGSGEDFPYEMQGALHFSNAGGVYLGRDTRTDRQVVLKEARPFAGLDEDGTDAVTRLGRERKILEQLSDLEFVPDLLEHRTCWEHHFLIEEYIEGDPLNTCMVARYPLARPDPLESEIATYTAWALDILGQVEQALGAFHRRGIIFGDLHPRNIMVRPDGRIALLDFEMAAHVDENRRPSLGAPGFVSSAARSGFDVDRYALACLRLWMFLPLNVLLNRDIGKVEMFVRVLTERFGVPQAFAGDVLQGLGVATPGERRLAGEQAQRAGKPPAVFLGDDRPDWRELRKPMTEAILASATPERSDRLFPGDPAQFRYGGLNLAYGAAGVLYALARTGAGVCPEHVDWLVHATRQARAPHPGLYNGLHGIAYVLDYLGRRDEALATLDRALALTADVRARGLFGGLAGIGLNLAHFAQTIAERSLQDAALRIAERLASVVRDPAAAPDLPSHAGLMHGLSGAALLFVHLYGTTADEAFLDLAATALRRDLAYCQTTDDGRLAVHDGQRLLPYLATGSAGIGLVLHEYLRCRPDEELASAQARLRRACQAEVVIQAGLFHGRAGHIAYLSRLRQPTQPSSDDAALDRHLDRLIWHAVPYQGYVGFVGDQLLRLSMDLATGSAGILLALHAAVEEADAFLPFLPMDQRHRTHETGVERRDGERR